MTFSNKKVKRTFVSPHSQNTHAYLDSIGWRKVEKKSTDGVTNMFIILSTAKANGRTVSGTINSKNQISILYLN